MRALGFSADDSLPAIFDLQRVEVLRGPQGTLFGAGSEGGTVRYITPQPNLTDFEVFSRAELAQTRRPEEHTSDLQSHLRLPYAVFCLNKTTRNNTTSNLIT